MNRRQFIATLSAAAAATALAPLEHLAPVEREAWLNETLLVGDVFTIGDIYCINPVTGSTGFLQQFIVTGSVVGSETVNISPHLPDGSTKIHKRRVNRLGTRT